MISPTESDIRRFWAKVDKSGDCWEWQAARTSQGYGHFTMRRKYVGAHRFSYALEYGPIAPGVEIDHRCQNKPCVNPKHLRAATRKQNREHLAGAYRSSKSGIRGVVWHKANRKWTAQVKHHGKNYYAGSFTHKEDAERAVIEARNRLFTFNQLDRKPND